MHEDGTRIGLRSVIDGERAGTVTTGGLDLDDVGAQHGEQAPGVWPGHAGGQFEHAQPGQWSAHRDRHSA